MKIFKCEIHTAVAIAYSAILIVIVVMWGWLNVVLKTCMRGPPRSRTVVIPGKTKSALESLLESVINDRAFRFVSFRCSALRFDVVRNRRLKRIFHNVVVFLWFLWFLFGFVSYLSFFFFWFRVSSTFNCKFITFGQTRVHCLFNWSATVNRSRFSIWSVYRHSVHHILWLEFYVICLIRKSESFTIISFLFCRRIHWSVLADLGYTFFSLKSL